MSGPQTPTGDAGEPSRRLLDDDAFQELMTAEFEAAGSPRDDLARARVWKRLAAQQRTQPAHRRLALSAVAAVVVAVVVGSAFLEQGRIGDGMREKGKNPPHSLTLTVAEKEPSGALTPLAGGAAVRVPVGHTLVFSTWAPPATRVVLLAQPRSQGPHVATLFVPKESGAASLIEKDGALFAYVVDPGDNIRFCALGVAVAEGDIDVKSSTVAAKLAEAADESSCVKVTAGPETP